MLLSRLKFCNYVGSVRLRLQNNNRITLNCRIRLSVSQISRLRGWCTRLYSGACYNRKSCDSRNAVASVPDEDHCEALKGTQRGRRSRCS
jgi:hypothetical protein